MQNRPITGRVSARSPFAVRAGKPHFSGFPHHMHLHQNFLSLLIANSPEIVTTNLNFGSLDGEERARSKAQGS